MVMVGPPAQDWTVAKHTEGERGERFVVYVRDLDGLNQNQKQLPIDGGDFDEEEVRMCLSTHTTFSPAAIDMLIDVARRAYQRGFAKQDGIER